MANMLAVAGPNSKYALGGEPAGFSAGVWHGLILPITFFVSLLDSGVRIYEVTNKGISYDIGFFFGIIGSIGTSGSTT